MLQQLKKQRVISILILLSLMMMALLGPHHLTYTKAVPINQAPAIVAPPCHQAQVTKTSASITCQQTYAHFCAILSDYWHSLSIPAGSILFFVIMAMLAISRVYPIFKPPKVIAIA